MEAVDMLVAIAAVRKIKSQYCYAMDVKDWALLRRCFTDRAVFDLRRERARSRGQSLDQLLPLEEAIAQGDPEVVVGAEAVTKMIQSAIKNWVTVHHLAEPLIEIENEQEASAIWPLFDLLDSGDSLLRAWGHYHERYRKVGATWLIDYQALTRLRSEGQHPWANKPV
ncbi:hypothetical protein DM806_17375 [Sphingobium lactosutens]|uniref:nuclear transport factor 2 family protein n=1 Tax=Sphingobium lactosutens TaxID=522773 RepID=UPI0015B9AEBA|nr:nuclear transport factor 2 family protein [Sphingobium lactosutens]NWK97405.1 hypothetical protein [Sphingobium lactosutens]